MTSYIHNNTYDDSMTVDKGTEVVGISSETGKQKITEQKTIKENITEESKTEENTTEQNTIEENISEESKSVEKELTIKNMDYFFTNYNDLVANNFGLIFDLKV